MPRLNDDTRRKLKTQIADCWLGCRFGDGLELQYIYNGVFIRGLNEMTDQELVEEFEQLVDSDDNPLLRECIAELEVEKMLNA